MLKIDARHSKLLLAITLVSFAICTPSELIYFRGGGTVLPIARIFMSIAKYVFCFSSSAYVFFIGWRGKWLEILWVISALWATFITLACVSAFIIPLNLSPDYLVLGTVYYSFCFLVAYLITPNTKGKQKLFAVVSIFLLIFMFILFLIGLMQYLG